MQTPSIQELQWSTCYDFCHWKYPPEECVCVTWISASCKRSTKTFWWPASDLYPLPAWAFREPLVLMMVTRYDMCRRLARVVMQNVTCKWMIFGYGGTAWDFGNLKLEVTWGSSNHIPLQAFWKTAFNLGLKNVKQSKRFQARNWTWVVWSQNSHSWHLGIQTNDSNLSIWVNHISLGT